jgi:glycosyltransferase involved in cell wall biosynthesis
MSAQENMRQPCTILLPLFNGSAFLLQSINNLREIAGPKDEILIIDDGSTDLTDQKIESFTKLDTRIVFHKCKHQGLVETLNYGIKVAANELIARADVDDVYEKDRIEFQVKYLTSNPRITAVFSDYKMVSPSGASLGIFPSAISPELTAFSLVSSQRTPHPSVMYRKSAVIATGGYLPEDFPAEDLGLWIRLVKGGEIASIPLVLLRYTVHNLSITQTRRELMQEKSHALRHKYASDLNIAAVCNSATKLLSGYKNAPYRDLRILFFLEDLLRFNQFTNGLHRKRIFIAIVNQILKRGVLLIPPALFVILMKMKRRSFRTR